MPGFLTRLFGSANERTLRRLWPVVEEVNGLEESFRALPDEAFPEKTAAFRQRLAEVEAEDAAAALEEILPEAFAAVREASRRTIGLRHFDVQLLGGIVLHEGKIAEMKTGEGKTLVATLPLYLNALPGKGAHLVTVNDYLARRDVQWMGPIYQFLGLTIASIIHDASFQFDLAYIPKDYRFLHLRPIERRDAYRADITYGTNNEFGFDYLRDNMKLSLDEYVQRELHYAIVDEVDNILIDEARTPLIISGPAEESTDKYFLVDRIISKLRNDVDYSIDEQHRAANLSEERVRIERENQTLATITIQNYFRMYAKLGGMTGTADTEAVEFKNIYKLDVVVMPPNKPMRRTDLPDVVYKSEREKFAAVVEEIKECHEKGQPVLVGTTSVEKSERVSKLLKKDGVKHNVLNAINHEAEANIIAQAGRFQQVTNATNMAGRGTDILLGGNPEFLARAEMENEWMRRAGSLQQSGKPHERYEDALRGLRERYDEEVQRAGDEYRKELADLEERRGEALRELTEVHRQILELSPYRALRARFEEVSSVELIPAVRDHDPVPPRYLRVKGELETALLGAGGGAAVASERAGLEELKARYGAVLDAWEQVGHRTDDTARELDERRAEYERGLSTFELALLVKGGAAGNGDLAELCARYRGAEDAYVEAERLHEEKRGPYEEALRAAEQRYEESRRQYVERVEEIREQLQKAPQEYEARHKEILEKYREVCAAEHEKVVAAGGLHILGTERHEARRIDNQLRGRGGRQGDPGSSRFYLSLEDDLLRIFGADRMQGLMQRLGMEEGVPIEHRLITRAIRNAQEKVEAHNFDIRKHLLEYDDVLNKQREVIYTRRRDLLSRDELKDDVLELAEGIAEDLIATHADAETASEEWDWKAIDDAVFAQFNFRLNLPEEERAGLRIGALQELLVERIRKAYEQRETTFSTPIMRHLEKLIMLQTLDALWKDHLLNMDHLKEGIGLRGYGQVNPLQAYQKEGYDMFEEMIRRMEADVIEKLMSVQLRTEAAGARPVVRMEGLEDEDAALPAELEAMERRQRQAARVTLSHGGPAEPEKIETVRRDGDKVGRNDPCPCGSGKKYKKCHGRA